MRQLATIAALSAALLTTPLSAEAIEEKNLISGKQKIDPAKGYTYLEANGRFAGTFVRVPDAEDIAEYRAARAEAFADERKRYAKRYASWQRDVVTAQKLKQKAPEEPVEPTEENFSFGAIEVRNAQSFGPDFRFAQDKERGTISYLKELKPGIYIWYGPVLLDPSQGYIGLCYCMGSVRFEVKAGEITNLGNSLFAAPRWENQATAPFLPIQHNGGLNGYRVRLAESSGTVSHALPPSLAAYSARVPELHASGKMNNFYGVQISRLPSIDGVLAYQRDTVIDVRTGQPLVEAVVTD